MLFSHHGAKSRASLPDRFLAQYACARRALALLLLAAMVALLRLYHHSTIPDTTLGSEALTIVLLSSLRMATGRLRYRAFANSSRLHGVPFHRLDVTPKWTRSTTVFPVSLSLGIEAAAP